MKTLQLLIGSLLTVITVFNMYFAFHHTSSQRTSICLESLNFFLNAADETRGINDVNPKLRSKFQKLVADIPKKEKPDNKPKTSPIIEEKVRKGIQNLAAATGSLL